MKYLPDNETLKWLNGAWDESLDWDQGNVPKLAKHDLTVDEVEEIFDGDFVFGGRLVMPEDQEWNEERYIIFGETAAGREVSLFWTRRGTKIRPITCRSMRHGERNDYRKTKGR